MLGAAIDTDVDPAPLLQGLDTNIARLPSAELRNMLRVGFVRDSQQCPRRRSQRLTARLRRDAGQSPTLAEVPPLRALMLPMLWLASLPYFLMITTQYGYTFWAPTMIRDALQASNTTTGLITGGIACAGPPRLRASPSWVLWATWAASWDRMWWGCSQMRPVVRAGPF